RAVGAATDALPQPGAVLPAGPAPGAAAPRPGAAPGTPARADSGYAITSEVVVENCSSCHRPDAAGRMGRISYLRKTPEGWQSSLRRMVALHGVDVEPDAARVISRYLSTAPGIAPEELAPARFEVEQRIVPFSFEDRDTERTCTACHSMGRVMTQ